MQSCTKERMEPPPPLPPPFFPYLYLHHLQNWQRERASVVKAQHCWKVQHCFSILLSRIEESKNILMNSGYSLNLLVILLCKPASNLHIFSWTYLIRMHFKTNNNAPYIIKNLRKAWKDHSLKIECKKQKIT